MGKKVIKTHFTRKNLIFIGLLFFYLVISLFCAICIDANGIMKNGNPIQLLGSGFGFPQINGSWQAYVLVILVLLYILFFASAFIYEMRLAKFYENKIWTKKWSIIYVSTFLISLILCFGIALVAQYPYDLTNIANSFLFLSESLITGFLVYIVLVSLIGATIMLYINFKNIDRPFRFFSARADEAMEEEREAEDEAREAEQNSLAKSFGETINQNTLQGENSGGIGYAQAISNQKDEKEELSDKEKVFPGLCTVDFLMENKTPEAFDDEDKQSREVRKWIDDYYEEGVLKYTLDAMNEYVSRFSANGIIGLFLFCFPFLYAMWKLFVEMKNEIQEERQLKMLGVLLSLISSFVAGCNGSLTILYAPWIVLAFAYAFFREGN